MRGRYLQIDLLEALKASSVVGVYIYQDEGKIVFANDAFLSFTGYSREEIIGKRVEDIIEGLEEKRRASENIRRRLKGEVFTYEYREVSYLTKQGFPKASLNFAYTIQYKGAPAGLVICIDVHKQKLYEKLYRSLSEINQLIVRAENEKELLRSICRILVDIVGFKLVVVGDARDYGFNVLHAWGEEKYLNYFKRVSHLIEDAQKKGKATIAKAFRTGEIAVCNNVYEDPDMSEYLEHFKRVNIYSVCSIPIFKGRKRAYVLVMYSDVPYQFGDEYMHILKELQMDLSFALERIENQVESRILQEAINRSFNWVLITDDRGIIVKINRAVERLSGYTQDELLGKTPRVFKSGYHSREFYSRFWENIKSGKVERYRMINRAKDGSLFHLDAVVVPIFSGGKLFRIVNIARDITREVQQKRHIERLSMLYKTLSDINQIILRSEEAHDVVVGVVDKMFEDMGCEVSLYIPFDKSGFRIDHYRLAKKEYENYIGALSSLEFGDFAGLPFFDSCREGMVFVENNIPKNSLPESLKGLVKEYGFWSCCALPVQDKDGVKGVVVSLFKEPDLFDDELHDLLEEIKHHIRYALERIETIKWFKIMSETIDIGFDFVVITDSEFKIVYVNENTLKASGYKRDELIGKHHSIFSSKIHSKSFVENFYKTLSSGKSFSGVMTYRTKDGRLIDALMNIVPFKSGERIEYFIAVGKDLRNEKQLQRTLERALFYDKVTHLINRDVFMARVKDFIERAKIDRSFGALVVVNPVNFSYVNKAFGFAAGDAVLKEIAIRLERILRESDVVARLESDKFGVLLKDMKLEDDVVFVVHKIISELSKPFYYGGSKITVSFTTGVALYPRDAQDADELIHRAMIGLEDAKKMESERAIGFYRPEFEREARSRMKLRSDLKDALLNDEFKLFYQPYFDSRTGQLAGAEALIRWIKDDRVILPGEFIPFLEETGDIFRVEEWVRDTVFQSLMEWERENLRVVPISINVSPSNFKRNEFLENIIYMADNMEIDPEFINIEITERMFLDDKKGVTSTMKTLKAYGFKFSIDDFGTGYSSLSYLSDLPVDFLKIDISFVREITTNTQTRSIVEVIIYLAKKLGLKSIAEGVETQEQFEILKGNGCDYIQGFLFSKPVSESEFKILLKRSKKPDF